jgi:hypothetical protein
LGASKILLKVVDLVAECGEFLFQFFDHGVFITPISGAKAPKQKTNEHVNADLKVGSTIT